MREWYFMRYNKTTLPPDITFQEVPNEVSITLPILGCPRNCRGCSWSSINLDPSLCTLDLGEFFAYVDRYRDYATCITVMGGEWDIVFITEILTKIKTNYPNLRLALYSGKYILDDHLYCRVIQLLDYLKEGGYVEELGPLSSKTTNQRFYDLRDKDNILNITNLFIKE